MKKAFLKALRESVPVFFCYLPLGAVFGMLIVEKGFPWFWAPLFSGFIFAGATQFLALTLFSAGFSLPMIALMTFPLSVRNVFYGLSMQSRYQNFPPLLKPYLAHGLVDATFSLLTLKPALEGESDQKYVTSLTCLNHLYWIFGAFVGGLLASKIKLPPGLEFSLAAFFMATSVEQFMQTRAKMPVFIAGTAVLGAVLIAPNHFFMTAVAMAFTLSVILPSRNRSLA